MSAAEISQAIDDIAEEFALFSDWEERYGHILELARALPPLTDAEHNDANKVRGCASQVWLVTEQRADAPDLLYFRGDSDAHLVRGLIALLLRIFSGRSAADILSVEPRAVFDRLGLEGALTPQRSNGLFSMMERIRRDAAATQS
ncbi:MAG: SufE family protein [Alphaproteobacteria bacterium]